MLTTWPAFLRTGKLGSWGNHWSDATHWCVEKPTKTTKWGWDQINNTIIYKLSSNYQVFSGWGRKQHETTIDSTRQIHLPQNPILGQRHQELLFQRLAVKQPTSSDSGVIVVLKDIPKNHFKLPSPSKVLPLQSPPHNQTTPPPWCFVPRTSSNFWSHAPWRIAFPTGEMLKD